MKNIFLLLFYLFIISVLGCGYTNSNPELPKAPEKFFINKLKFDSAEDSLEVYKEKGWWSSLLPKRWHGWVSQVIVDNLSVEEASQRLLQLKAQLMASRSGFFPNVEANIQRSEFSGTNGFFGGGAGGPAGPAGPVAAITIDKLYQSSIPISYELDIWGKVFGKNRAANERFLGGVEDLEAAKRTIVSSAVRSILGIIEGSSLTRIIKKQIKENSKQLELVNLRFTEGAGSYLSVLQQEQQLMSLKTELPSIERAYFSSCNELTVLASKVPKGCKRFSKLVKKGKKLSYGFIPKLKSLPNLSNPISVLNSRPDIKAIVHRINATDHDVAVALLERLPNISLSLSFQYNALKLSELFESSFKTLGRSLGVPLVDGGRRRAEVRRTKAKLAELMAQYKREMLNVLKEVSNAYENERTQKKLVVALAKQVKVLEGASELSFERYRNGLSSYLDVIVANDSLYRSERRLVSEKRKLLDYRVALHQAIGSPIGCGNPSSKCLKKTS